jgi:hypothetical protein
MQSCRPTVHWTVGVSALQGALVIRLPPKGTQPPPPAFPSRPHRKGQRTMKGILAWLIGIPIPLIILLYLLDVF